jgi:hypothetical protein
MKSPTINFFFSLALARIKEFTSDWKKLTSLTQGCCSANINAESGHSWLDTDTESLHLSALVIIYIIITDSTFKVAGSIPDGVIGFFHWLNPSGRTMALGSTQPLIEMSTRNVFWSKGGRCVGLTTLPHSRSDCLKIWETQPPGTLGACSGL